MFCGTVVFGEGANEATRLGCGRKTTDARVVEGGFIFFLFSFFSRVFPCGSGGRLLGRVRMSQIDRREYYIHEEK